MRARIAVLAGDGIGPEIMEGALAVLDRIGTRFNHQFEFERALIGGAAHEESGAHFPDRTRGICAQSDAILFGSVGGPLQESHLEKWRNCEANSILALRKEFQFFANLRPAKVFPDLVNLSPLKESVLGSGVDVLIVRELLGDIYFGEHSRFEREGRRTATDIAEYDEEQIARIAITAFEAAASRRKSVVSVDKANVLATSRLWREVMHEVRGRFPEIAYQDMLVDNCAMQLIRSPSQFDVVVTSNMFGDILSDAAAMLPGSLGLTPSASLNAHGFGLYEPSGGSAPDIAGRGIANPTGQILSAAMMLRYSFRLHDEAACIEQAVAAAIAGGARTADICEERSRPLSTGQFVDAVLENI